MNWNMYSPDPTPSNFHFQISSSSETEKLFEKFIEEVEDIYADGNCLEGKQMQQFKFFISIDHKNGNNEYLDKILQAKTNAKERRQARIEKQEREERDKKDKEKQDDNFEKSHIEILNADEKKLWKKLIEIL